jgi:hypothetical protein
MEHAEGTTVGSRRTIAGYVLGPVVAAMALGIAVLPPMLHLTIPAVGPFDETVVWWTVFLPVAVLVPWAVAMGELLAGPHVRRRVTVGLAIVIIGLLAVPLAMSTRQIGCDPNPDRMQVLAATAAVAAAGTVGFVATVWATTQRIERPARAISISAIGTVVTLVVTLFVFVAAFAPGVSCAPTR